MSAIEDYQSLEQLSEDIALNRERCHKLTMILEKFPISTIADLTLEEQ